MKIFIIFMLINFGCDFLLSLVRLQAGKTIIRDSNYFFAAAIVNASLAAWCIYLLSAK